MSDALFDVYQSGKALDRTHVSIKVETLLDIHSELVALEEKLKETEKECDRLSVELEKACAHAEEIYSENTTLLMGILEKLQHSLTEGKRLNVV